MSTRCRIGIENEDGTIESVYCHSDGYPPSEGDNYGVGYVLATHYTDRAKALAIVAGGGMSILDSSHESCVFYARDRGEANVDADCHRGRDEFATAAEQCDARFIYLLTRGGWQWRAVRSPWEPRRGAWRSLKVPPAATA